MTMENEPDDVTDLLGRWNKGDEEAQSKLVKLIYNDLHARAENYMRYERQDHTLQPTALINEVYLRLIKQKGIAWQNRSQFYGVIAQIMRRILVDHARNHYAAKRGGNAFKVSIDEVDNISGEKEIDLMILDDSLNRLAEMDLRQSQIVEMRFFGGLSVEETAEALGISAITVQREWRISKMWLYNELKKQN